MTDFEIRGARLLDPSRGVDREGDLVVRDDRIVGESAGENLRSIDGKGLIVVPGLIDLHVHLREPGEEYKEDIESGTAAAVAGGFTAVCCMPNTCPPNDRRSVTDLIVHRAQEVGSCRVFPVGAMTRGLAGESLAEIGELAEAGCVALSDDGMPVMNAELMRRAMEYARTFGLPVIQHAEDHHLSRGAPMNEGVASTRAGLSGQPAAAEEVMVARDLALVELTGARYHVAHLSTGAALRRVREAKQRGLPVTCEVTPHHLTLTDEACLAYDTSTKCNPPLRTDADVEALREGLADGTIDAVATDHAPHSSVEKDVEFDHAAFGMIGLETAVGLVLRLVHDGVLDLPSAIERMTAGPARVLGWPTGGLEAGATADLTVLDLDRTWTYRPEEGRSRSRNTPFAGAEFRGRAVLTVVGGRIVHDEVAR